MKELVELDQNILQIRAQNFIGRYSFSSNFQYLVGWKTQGSPVLFLENEYLLWEKQLTKVIEAKVSDMGYVALSEWTDPAGYKGCFWVFVRDGRTLLKAEMGALPMSVAIDPQGTLACCWASYRKLIGKTHVTDAEAFVFSLTSPSLLFSAHLPECEVEAVARSGKEIVIVTKSGAHRFSEDGTPSVKR
ncbi:MAG: hypothetical protein ABSD13_10360 [Candidatus Korobacteraceae bacterium]|jgi:hypothetical protein